MIVFYTITTVGWVDIVTDCKSAPSGDNTVAQKTFLDEFVKRDLNNIESLNNLQWRIKGQKLTKEKVLEYLSSNEGREMLDKQKTIKLIDNYANDVNYRNEITNVKEVLEFMESNNDWYNLIFK